MEQVEPNSESRKEYKPLIKTIFYQGIYNSQTQLAKYCDPQKGFVATTGETVRCDKGLELIIDPFIGVEIDEIEPYTGSWIDLINPLKLLSYLFALLINWNNFTHLSPSIPNIPGIPGSPGKEKKNATLKTHLINLFKVNFGQEGDLANHQQKYSLCRQEFPDHDLILWGVSKGAATTLNALVKNKYDLDRIKMVVLEGCFSNIEEVFRGWVSYRSKLDGNYWIARFVLWLMGNNMIEQVTRYKKDPSYDPFNTIQQVPPEIPIALITSEVDIVVPPRQTISLYERLKEIGHPNVHLLVLKNSRHPAYMLDSEEDRQAYLTFMTDLYSKYQLQ